MNRLKKIERTFLAIVLLVLSIEGLFVFRPAVRKIRSLISEHIAARAELRAANENLENRIAGRTSDLSQANETLRNEIAGRKQAERQIRSQNKLLKSTIESLTHPFYVIDVSNYTVIMSNSAAGFGDFSAGSTCYALTHGRKKPCYELKDLCPVQHVKKTKKPVTIERTRYDEDGKPRIMEIHGYPIFDDEGKVVQMIEYSFDITEKKQAEKEIKILARFPDENPGPVMRISQDGIVRYANKASRPLLDFWGCEVNGPLPDDLRRSVSDMIENDNCQEIEVRTADKVLSTIFSPISESEYLNIYAIDITQKKTLEHKLAQSQKLEAVGKLAGGIAHDFNNILTAIIGYSEQALNKLGDDNHLAEDIKEILKAGERAASLTRQLLAFSRTQILELKVLSLNEVIRNMWKMLRRLISENIELITVLSPSLSSIKADVGQIEQVIMNLAINARDAMPDGGRLTIETANVDLDETYADNHIAVKPGSYVMLAVNDTGSGIDEQTRERIFEPFFTTKELGKGTGLGLSTIYGIVKQIKGNIWVYSEPGKGTSFKIYFPAVSQGSAACEPPQSESRITRGSETILLVEDEDAIRNLASLILRKNGYTVFEARDGIEALEISRRIPDPIHLLVTDVIMPRMGGRELSERLTSSRPETKVLFISGYTDDAIVHHVILEKGVVFLQKPFTASSLASKAREALSATEQQTENNEIYEN